MVFDGNVSSDTKSGDGVSYEIKKVWAEAYKYSSEWDKACKRLEKKGWECYASAEAVRHFKRKKTFDPVVESALDEADNALKSIAKELDQEGGSE